MLLFSFSSHMLGADSEVLRLLMNSYQRFPRFSGASYRTRSILEIFGKYLPKIRCDARFDTPIYILHPLHFRISACWIVYGTGLEFSIWHLQGFLLGAACGLVRVCDSSSHSNFRCARSRAALGSNSSCSMCRQSFRQSARTMRSAAGRPNLGRCQSG